MYERPHGQVGKSWALSIVILLIVAIAIVFWTEKPAPWLGSVAYLFGIIAGLVLATVPR